MDAQKRQRLQEHGVADDEMQFYDLAPYDDFEAPGPDPDDDEPDEPEEAEDGSSSNPRKHLMMEYAADLVRNVHHTTLSEMRRRARRDPDTAVDLQAIYRRAAQLSEYGKRHEFAESAPAAAMQRRTAIADQICRAEHGMSLMQYRRLAARGDKTAQENLQKLWKRADTLARERE